MAASPSPQDQDAHPQTRPQDQDDAITSLLTTFNDLNPSTITTLTSPPSALEFMRYVALNQPFVVRGGAADWDAVRSWGVGGLKEAMAGRRVNVAVTPFGNADAPNRTQDGELVFVKPWEEMQDFDEFLDYVVKQEKEGKKGDYEEVRYAQTQNNNLPQEYHPLSLTIPSTIPFARLALQQDAPDAANLWIGNSHSTTALHKDPYQNIYVQVLGRKHFVLMSPVCYPCVGETVLRRAGYVRVGQRGGKSGDGAKGGNQNDSTDGVESGDGRDGVEHGNRSGLEIRIDDDEEPAPVAVWDPDEDPDEEEDAQKNTTNYRHLANPIRVTLEEGDMLYLPALWYHKVSQSCSEEGICCAVNYWYDMEFSGSFWALCSFLRNVVLEKNGGRTGN